MILCCGEALIDMLPRHCTGGESGFAPFPGGAVFNTAIALGRLGAPVELFNGLSSDFFGEMLAKALAESGVGTQLCRVSERPTTLAFVRLDKGQAQYLFYDEATAGRMLSIKDLPAIAPEVDAMLFGAISLIPEPCGSAYEELMSREHAKRVIMLDPNIRPGFIPDAASHRARMMRMIAMADIVKVSDEDMAWFGEDGDISDIARRWLGLGPSLIVVTLGAAGAIGYAARHTVKVEAPPVDVIDTVGAGDTFNAGLLASLHEQSLLEKAAIAELSEMQIGSALTLAARAAAVTVSRAGANPPWRRELQAVSGVA